MLVHTPPVQDVTESLEAEPTSECLPTNMASIGIGIDSVSLLC